MKSDYRINDNRCRLSISSFKTLKLFLFNTLHLWHLTFCSSLILTQLLVRNNTLLGIFFLVSDSMTMLRENKLSSKILSGHTLIVTNWLHITKRNWHTTGWHDSSILLLWQSCERYLFNQMYLISKNMISRPIEFLRIISSCPRIRNLRPPKRFPTGKSNSLSRRFQTWFIIQKKIKWILIIITQ